ncbi:unnamed protein product [Acanthoscelides obtectus]|nr:unnamed protein product [Acanthoscelides obtectus]CAK1636087.1 Aryl hydrocarbon receptor [Acanthoscelides obtectus]
MLLGYSDSELASMGGYDLVHYDDLAYVASAHQELLKTGASGMIAYRFQTKEGQWQWLQTSSRLVYKNSKPDFVISTHRPLMEEEGRDLLGKRTMDFKVSYLDAGLPNNYFSENELLSNTTSSAHSNISSTPTRVNRRYKTQLRDFLSTCRTKRKLATSSGQVTPPANPTIGAPSVVSPMATAAVDYITTDGCSAAAAAAAYNMYTSPYPAAADHTMGYMGHSNFQHTLYPPTATALDNRYLATTDNLFHQYRPLGTYYPDYHASATAAGYVSNGFLDASSRTYDPGATYRATVMPTVDDKIYSCQQVVENTKYPTSYVVPNSTKCLDVSWPYSVSPSSGIIQPIQVMSTPHHQIEINHKEYAKVSKHPSVDGSHHSASPTGNHLLTPKMEDIKSDGSSMGMQSSPPQGQSVTPQHFSPAAPEMPRQTVLMWGSNHMQHPSPVSSTRSPVDSVGEYAPMPHPPPTTDSCMEIAAHHQEMCKWSSEPAETTPPGGGIGKQEAVNVQSEGGAGSPHQHHTAHHNQHHNSASRVVMVL